MFRFFPYICFFILSFFIAHSSDAEQRDVLETKSVRVIFDAPLTGGANHVIAIYDGLISELEGTLNWRLDYRPDVLLIKENSVFRQMTGNSLFVAFAIPEKKLIVIDFSKMNIHPFSLPVTLKHELCHLLLHHHISKANLPKWIDEGVCQWVSDGISEFIMDKRSVLNEAIVSNQLIPLNALTYRFPNDKTALSLAYEESKSIVEYIIKEFGNSSLLGILNDLKSNIQIAEAVRQNLGISLGDLEARWCEALKKRINWFVYFSIHLYEILFFLAALTTIYGFIRLVKKKREYQDEEEEDWQ